MTGSNQRSTRMLCLAILWLITASSAPAADPVELRAGPLTMLFDTDNAFLRYIKAGPYEVLRGINAPVRNQFWGTVKPVVSNVQLVDGGDRFELTFDVTCRERDIDFRWQGRITGSETGVVEFRFDGTAHSTFMRNRIGFCVLHGPSAAGKPWIIETVDGQKSKGQFPTFISPHQPAKQIRSVSHQLAPDLWTDVQFEGDVFEMEDQRNWTDASFKTYCTPLEIPYPVEVKQGTRISQTIRFSVKGDVPADSSAGQPVVLTVLDRQSSLPRIGLQVSSEIATLRPLELERLKALHLDHLQVDLNPADEGFVDYLRRANRQARALGVSLHVGIHLGEHLGEHLVGDLERLAAELQRTRPNVSVYLILGADQQQFQTAHKHLRPVVGEALIGIGKDTNFVDLNRDRPTGDELQAVSYGVNPQIHAVDNASMMETLPVQGDTVRSARQFAGSRPLIISPITLRPQQVSQEPGPGELPANVDIRQTSLLAAAWTLGSIKYLAEADADYTTYYETVGWLGVMDSEAIVPRPGTYPTIPGSVYPIYHVLREIGEFAGGKVQHVECSEPLAVAGLALRKPGKLMLLIANLTERQQAVALRGLGESEQVRFLDAGNIAVSEPESWPKQPSQQIAAELPIVLPPYGIARIVRAAD